MFNWKQVALISGISAGTTAILVAGKIGVRAVASRIRAEDEVPPRKTAKPKNKKKNKNK